MLSSSSLTPHLAATALAPTLAYANPWPIALGNFIAQLLEPGGVVWREWLEPSALFANPVGWRG